MNIILATDSYKLNHWNQYPPRTEGVYSYFESREGAKWPYTVFFGLQYLLKEYLVGEVVNLADILQTMDLAKIHFGRPLFNLEGWQHIHRKHKGGLPLRIKAVSEGTPIPTGNVLMTVENTDPECYWLTNAVESLLTHVWYPSTVATLSRTTKTIIAHALSASAESNDGLPFMLHDFGYRGASSHESAAIGGAAHLISFQGTDTLPAIELAQSYYKADLGSLAFSVPATEHSVMTALGREGEMDIVDRLISEYPTGILSVVGDSYNIYDFVRTIGDRFKDRIKERDGVFVVRPDSITLTHPRPADLIIWILEQLAHDFGVTINSKGYKVLDPHIRVLWGDGLDPHSIEKILNLAMFKGFSVENLVFGMGGGLLQKGIDRDTQRFAFKASAQKRDGKWHYVYKEPLGSGKISKKGRLRLERATTGEVHTVEEADMPHDHQAQADILETVFENGDLVREYTFDEVRANSLVTLGAE